MATGPEPLHLDDDGIVTVEIGESTTSLDLYLVHDKLVELCRQFKEGNSQEFHEAILEVIQADGLPRGSHRLASKFSIEQQGETEALGEHGRHLGRCDDLRQGSAQGWGAKRRGDYIEEI